MIALSLQAVEPTLNPDLAAASNVPTHTDQSESRCVASAAVTQAEAAADAPRVVLRGSPARVTDLMEAYQAGYIRAVAAAAGCATQWPEIDEGVDVSLTHRSQQHSVGDQVARLDVQMKSTSAVLAADSSHVSARVSRKRYDEFAVPDPTIHKIVVILTMPADQENWLISGPEFLRMHNCAYWVNLAGSAIATATSRP